MKIVFTFLDLIIKRRFCRRTQTKESFMSQMGNIGCIVHVCLLYSYYPSCQVLTNHSGDVLCQIHLIFEKDLGLKEFRL